MSTICVSASPLFPGRKMLSLSTEYEFLASCAVLCLLSRQGGALQDHAATPDGQCAIPSAALLQQGALGAAGQEPVVALSP